MTKFEFPSVFAVDERWQGNVIRQLVRPGYSSDITVKSYSNKRLKGHLITSADGEDGTILALPGGIRAPAEFVKVLRVEKGCLQKAKVVTAASSKAKWVRHPGLLPASANSKRYKKLTAEVLNSWQNGFFYLEEDSVKEIKGLRKPQAAAVHAVYAHWAVSDEAATVVMPTGTGKTETMLSVLVSMKCPRLLVVVPTDALRTQIADKFLTLGVLKQYKVASSGCMYPVVGILKHRPKTPAEVNYFFERCNVVVSTIQIAGQCEPGVRERMAELCPYLFIDEAHHIAAQTWRGLKRSFESKKARVLQFTATPFREDDRPVDGKVIFRYPLGRAQEEGYFKPIHFRPVNEFDPTRADHVIAARAVEQLRKDRKKYNHLLMARVDSIKKAEEVFSIYQKYKDLAPVQLHTGLTPETRRENRDAILSGRSKAVVCVDMLGEGFDLPELKVAAFHDVRKGLAVTLQLAGRFTRARSDLGDATFIANIADVNVRQELAKLYSQDADWNSLLQESSEAISEKQKRLQNFIEPFTDFPKNTPLQNFCPQMSTAIYRTTCREWAPLNFEQGIPGYNTLERKAHDVYGDTLIILTGRKVQVEWAKIKELYNWDWGLYILFWDKARGLLFIHSSKSNSYNLDLAEAVAGDPVRRAEEAAKRNKDSRKKIYTVSLVKGSVVFRCFHGINRIRLLNVGLSEHLGRRTRYTMRAGSNVGPDIPDPQKALATKSVIFGTGYENGERVSLGCSRRGRIWANQADNIEVLRRWCEFIGEKVSDERIDPDEVLKGTLTEKLISKRPEKMPIAIDWPEVIYREPESSFIIKVGEETELLLHRADIRLKKPGTQGELLFEVCSESVSLEFALRLYEGIPFYEFEHLGPGKVSIERGDKDWWLEEFFNEHPPVIWFADGSSLEGNAYIELKNKRPPYDSNKIIASWDWKGVNIKQEAQITRTKLKDPASIQHRVIKTLKAKSYDIIFDDDGAGESADVVAVRRHTKRIAVEFYHCKYSSGPTPGARVEDLYEVCGQAQKSINWLENPARLFAHLIQRGREKKRKYNKVVGRFERGDDKLLLELMERSKTQPVELKIFIVQPGLSKAKVKEKLREMSKEESSEQSVLRLLGVTESYLLETRLLPFGVIGSR